ncbi:MAG: anti-sigma factor antagonist [Oscillospiraceae bacterium]|nr:anti-sigma factor antagonist [Oscillospiraceae bacterium]
MKVSSQRCGGELKISLSGELDHHAARRAIPEITAITDIELPVKLVIDFERVSFTDSSGIALVIGAYKRATSIGSGFCVINVSKQAYKVFSAAGICKLLNISEREKDKVNI